MNERVFGTMQEVIAAFFPGYAVNGAENRSASEGDEVAARLLEQFRLSFRGLERGPAEAVGTRD